MARAGFRAPEERPIPVIWEEGATALKIGVYLMKQSRRISYHDEKIAHHLIRVLTGGSVPRTLVPEWHLRRHGRGGFERVG